MPLRSGQPPPMYSVSQPNNGMSSNGPNHISPPPGSRPSGLKYPSRPPGPSPSPGPRPFPGLSHSLRPPGVNPPRPPGVNPLPRPPGINPPSKPPGVNPRPRPPGVNPPPQPPVINPPPQPRVTNPPPRPRVINPPPQPRVINPPPQPRVTNPPPQPRVTNPPPRPCVINPLPRPPVISPRTIDISCGPAICIVVVLTLLMICRIDLLEPFIDIKSATRHVSIENSTLAVEKGKMGHEREAMAREKELWKKAKEDRIPHGAFWEDVWPAWDCRAYGKREYWGVLRNIPEGWSATDACMNMPVEIKGVTVRRPYRCERVWGSPHIRGYWMVDWDQPDCKPWYRDYKDVVSLKYPPFSSHVCLHKPPLVQGCTSNWSGKRRIEAQIVGINKRREQNWRLLCNTTPLIWNLKTYMSPANCEERVSGFSF